MFGAGERPGVEGTVPVELRAGVVAHDPPHLPEVHGDRGSLCSVADRQLHHLTVDRDQAPDERVAGRRKRRSRVATGLPDPQHKASSRDLAILARAIIHDSTEYYPIYAEKEFKFNNIKQGNRNALLYTDPTVDGLKTGHTSEAGFCLTASAKRDGMRLISVVMGANSMQARADQTRALFAWGFGQFERAVPARTGAPLGQAPVRFGKEDLVPAVLQQDFSLLVPRGQAQQVKTSVQYTPGLTAPIQQGAVVGKIVATIDGQTYAEQPLVAQQAVEEAGFFKRLWQRILSWFGK